MKNKILALFVAIISIVTVFALAGCAQPNVKKVEIDGKDCYVFTASDDVLKIKDNTTVADYLNALKDKGGLEFEGYDSDYGLYITSVNGLKEQFSDDFTSGSYWSLYLDFTTLDGDGAIYADENDVCEYEGKTYYYALSGFSGIPCVEGHTYVLAYVSYDYGNWN